MKKALHVLKKRFLYSIGGGLYISHFDNLISLLSCQQILQLSMVLKCARAESVALHGAESLFWNADTGDPVAVHGPEMCIVKETILTVNAESS